LITQPKVRHGLVVDEILAEAREGEYDLVVIGAHQPGKGRALLLDNIAKKIIQDINRSLLVVNPKNE
jgi:nucleotide-binding universal stress UspA family protein